MTVNRALIVEDLPDVRQRLVAVVGEAFPDVEVVTAARCDKALDYLGVMAFDLALVDLGLPDGNGLDVITALRRRQPHVLPVVITIYDNDEHLFPALQAGALGYLLKDQSLEMLCAQLLRIARGEPTLSPPIARRVLAHFSRAQSLPQVTGQPDEVSLSQRETEVLQWLAKGYTHLEVAEQLSLSRHTVGTHIKQIYRKLDVNSRAEAALEAVRRGLVRP